MAHEHHHWLEAASESIRSDWNRQRELARHAERTQQVGHEHETTWSKFLENWLPPQYEVATRKYIVGTHLNQGRPSETDVVIFRPSYPRQLRRETHIMAAGVAAAFSVKLTLKSAGLREAVKSSASLQRSLIPRTGNARDELWKPYLYGVLAGSHDWKAPNSTPSDNISKLLSDYDEVEAAHPTESLDLLCVADLGVWAKALSLSADYRKSDQPEVIETSHQAVSQTTFSPLLIFLSSLYERLSWQDEELVGLAQDFRITSNWKGSQGFVRYWDPALVLSPEALLEMRKASTLGRRNGADSRVQGLN